MPIPDKFHRILQKLIEKEKPGSVEEMEKLMNSLMGRPLPDLPDEDLTPEDRALDLVDEAWQSPVAKGKKMARQALETWPDCIPAYEYLAAKTKLGKKHTEYLEKGVEIGKRLFGGEFLAENRGYFWGIAETRPYMRCLDGLAHANALTGHISKAIVIWEDMMSLNEQDNQGIRYNLLPAFLRQQDLVNYHRYRAQFDEGSSMFSFNDALASFMENGTGEEANSLLDAATQNNPYIVPLLLADSPPTNMPDSYTLNSPEEAIFYVSENWQVWHEVPGAVDWLKKMPAKKGTSGMLKPPPPLQKLPLDELRILLNVPYSPLSPLQLRPGLTDEDVAKADLQFLRLAQQLLLAIQSQGPLKLTAKGNLPRKMVHQLYGLKIYSDKYIDDGTTKIMGEEDFFQLNIAHILCKSTKLVSKRSGKASLTKKGKLMLESPAQLYLTLLQSYTENYNWAYPERWGYGVEQTGQVGWACIMYELVRQGDRERGTQFYMKPYLDLFPSLLEQYPRSEFGTPEQKAKSDFNRRFFHWFCGHFGLAESTRKIKGKNNLTKETFVKRTALAERVFQLVSLR